MLQKLNGILSPMQGKNVDIMIENSGVVLMTVSTEEFDVSVDDLHLTIGNNCKDCQFESKFIVDHIAEIDDSDLGDDDTVIIRFNNEMRLHITKI